VYENDHDQKIENVTKADGKTELICRQTQTAVSDTTAAYAS
jgi:hypothetical protein